MISNSKWLAAVTGIAGIILVCSSSVSKINEEEDRYNKILHTVGYILQKGHYAPTPINDQFSEKIFSAFLKEIDPEKNIFLEDDISVLKKFDNTIDDEILGAPVAFFYRVNELYKKRLFAIKERYPAMLEKTFSFNQPDSIISVYEKINYPTTSINQDQTWYKKLQYMALEKLVQLQDEREISKNDTLVKKQDSTLEREARIFTLKTMGKSLDRLLRKTTDDDRFSLFINVITNTMDPHTDYFMPVAKRSWDEGLSGKFYGIGAVIGEENGYVKISTVSHGGPAWKTGEINDGDLILKIAQGNNEPVDVAGYDVPDAVKLFRGTKGTTVQLTVKKIDGTIKLVTIVREELKLEETFAKSYLIEEGGRKTGYIYLPKFYSAFGEAGGRSCHEDVAAELVKLQNEKVDGVIIDLRNNGGGSLLEVVRMVGLFIPEGPVVQVKNSDGRSTFHKDEDKGKVLYSGALVVMVNEFSASASEIFAAAIQDYKRGIVAGSSSTYGKGTVQRPIPLNDEPGKDNIGTIHLTMQKYYRVNGASTQLRGVEPDLVLPGYYEFYKIKERDNPASLAWDELKELQYKPWLNQPDLNFMKLAFQKRNDSSGVLVKIKQHASWLALQQDAPDYLQITRYRQQVKKIKEQADEARQLLKLAKEMNIKLTGGDTSTTGTASADRNSRWLNFLKKDMYVREASLIVQDMNGSARMTNNFAKLPSASNSN
ncbi:MAG: carboxy terminal-processing peptidase [Ferruginibacter sp.]|nr:carboxy terminal-processing peptidase [Chitinophagaceae bacterium]